MKMTPCKLGVMISSIIISNNIHAAPSVTIDGAKEGAHYTSQNAYTSESGNLAVKDGGVLEINSDMVVGQNKSQSASPTTASILIDGKGSILSVKQRVFLGDSDPGYKSNISVDIKNGGRLTADNIFSLARSEGDSASLTIDGPGSSLFLDKTKVDSIGYIGDSGNALLNITNGANITAGQLVIARSGDSVSSVNVSGQGSFIDAQQIVVGNDADGTLMLTNGASLKVDNGNGDIYIANGGSSHGRVVIGDGGNIGNIDVGNVAFGQGQGQLSFNFNNPQYIFTGRIKGSGDIIKDGDGELILTGDNSYFNGVTTVEKGTLKLSGGTSHKTYGGDIHVHTEGTFVSDSASVLGNIQNNGKVIFLQDNNGGFANVISGQGLLIKDGKADLTLAGDDSAFKGKTNVVNGTLIIGDAQGNGKLGGDFLVDKNAKLKVTADSITGNIESHGETTFIQNTDSRYEHILTGDGDIIKDGTGALTLTKDNALYSGNLDIREGDLIVGVDGNGGIIGGNIHVEKNGTLTGNSLSLQANIISDGQTNFKQVVDGNFSQSLSGSGEVSKSGAAILGLSGDNSHFKGNFVVHEGQLQLVNHTGNSVFGGNLTIEKSASLEGATDVLGNVVIADGARHILGDQAKSIQRIHGNYVNYGELNESGNNQEINHVAVDGNVDVTNAILNLTLSPDSASQWQNINKPLTVIDNKGSESVTGQFGKITTNLLFLAPFVDYEAGDGNDIAMTFTRNDLSFADVAETYNQKNAANSVNGLSGINPLWQTFASSTSEDEMRSELDMVSGEIHPAVQSVLITNSHYLSDAMNERLLNLKGMKHSEFSYGESASADDAIDKPTMWSRGYGAWGKMSATENTAGMTLDANGLLMGMDIPKPYGRLGIVFGYGNSNAHESKVSSSAKIESYYSGIYLGREWNKLAWRNGVGVGWHSISTTRNISFGGYSDRLTGDYKSRTGQIFSELAYDIYKSDVLSIEPYLNGQYIYTQIDSFDESGCEAALKSAGVARGVALSNVGLRTDREIYVKSIAADIYGKIGWQHYYNNTVPYSHLSFADSDSFSTQGTPLSRDIFSMETGFMVQITNDINATVSYKGQLANGSQNNSAWANLTIGF